MKAIVFYFILTIIFYDSNAQFFQGRIGYKNFYLENETLKQLFDPVQETLTIKGGKCKTVLPEAQKGQLEWQIDDYYNGVVYSRKSYKNVDYFQTDKEPIIKDGKLVLLKPDSPMVAPILKGKLCAAKADTMISYSKMDTTFDINGLLCYVILEYRNKQKIGEYYYHDAIKLDSNLYKCKRLDRLDNVYRLTNGALIVQLVSYGESYTYIQQVQSIENIAISDSEFDIPKGIKIEDIKYDN